MLKKFDDFDNILQIYKHEKNSLNENQLSESDQVEIHNLVINSNNVNLNNISYSVTGNEVSEGLAFLQMTIL